MNRYTLNIYTRAWPPTSLIAPSLKQREPRGRKLKTVGSTKVRSHRATVPVGAIEISIPSQRRHGTRASYIRGIHRTEPGTCDRAPTRETNAGSRRHARLVRVPVFCSFAATLSDPV